MTVERVPHRSAANLRVCECGEWTYSPTCGPCRRPACPVCMAAAGSPECCTPETLARIITVRPCGCVVGRDQCGQCPPPVPEFAIGTASYGRWSR